MFRIGVSSVYIYADPNTRLTHKHNSIMLTYDPGKRNNFSPRFHHANTPRTTSMNFQNPFKTVTIDCSVLAMPIPKYERHCYLIIRKKTESEIYRFCVQNVKTYKMNQYDYLGSFLGIMIQSTVCPIPYRRHK